MATASKKSPRPGSGAPRKDGDDAWNVALRTAAGIGHGARIGTARVVDRNPSGRSAGVESQGIQAAPQRVSAPLKGKHAMLALGRLKTGVLNKTEQAYQEHLIQRQHAGEVAWFKFEGIKLRLADNTHYTPDFAVMLADGQMEIHETKGFWTDDARVKIKVAAELYPFRFFAIKKKAIKVGGGWEVEAF